jgi:hypothetical protein
MNTLDPLAELLVDADSLDRAAIAGAIKNRVGINGSDGRLTLLEGYDRLDARRKVAVILLARKAASLLGISDTEAVSYKEAVTTSGLAGGTVAPALRTLKDQRIADQTDSKAYFVPNAAIPKAVTLLKSQVNGYD